MNTTLSEEEQYHDTNEKNQKYISAKNDLREMTKKEQKTYDHNFSIYSKLKTFTDLCSYCYLYTTNKVMYFPMNFPSETDSLYEEGDNIQYYMPEFNRYCLFTSFSQPSQKLTDNTYKQRSAVEGYIPRKKGEKIYEKLKNDQRIFINMIYPNDKIEYNTIDSPNLTVTRSKKKGITHFYTKYSREQIKYYKNDLVKLEIADRQYGTDDQYVFKTLLQELKKLNKPIDSNIEKLSIDI